MKISRISLRDFRGFPGPDDCSLDLDQGRNLLLYGENGSGKSSIFEALKGVFNHHEPATFGDRYANVFTSAEDGFVSIDLTDANPGEYRWDQGDVPSGDAEEAQYLDIARRAVFLDYRDLLKTHFIHREAARINLFDLLVESLLADVDFGDGQALSKHWKLLQDHEGTQPPRELDDDDDESDPPSRYEVISGLANDFKNRLDGLLHTPTEHQPCLVDTANNLLASLDPNLRIALRVTETLCPPKSLFTWKKRFDRRAVFLEVTYAGHTPTHPGHFLNEARLTAIALSLFLAGAKLNRPAAANGQTLRLLVLDDVLIGLDIAHRIPLLNLLKSEFSDWQTFIFTHDLTWFEMARQQVDDNEWAICELFCEQRPGEPFERPVLRQGGANGFLKRAKDHLQAGEKRAAAVYVRAAFEEKIRKYCSDKSISLPFKSNPSQIDGDTFLNAAETRVKNRGHWKLYGDLFHRLKMLRKVILNPLSHSNLVNIVRPEIADSIEAIEALKLETPDAHPSRDECEAFLASALRTVLPIAAARLGIDLSDVDDNEVRTAIEQVKQIEILMHDKKNAKPALERARALAAEQETLENKLLMATLLRAAFEGSLVDFVIRKHCKLPYSSKWDAVKSSTLWDAVKEHSTLQGSTARLFVAAVDSPANKPILFDDLDPATLSTIDWTVFVALLNTLETVAPDVTYSFQTKLDRFAK